MGRFFVAVFLVFFSGAWAADRPVMGGTLRMGTDTEIGVLNPFVGTRSTEHNVRTLLYEPLLMERDFEPRPYLAESWEISRDGKEYTFRLKKGVRFHDGREMTADDAKWSVDYTLDLKNGAYGRPDLSMIQSAEAVSPQALRIRLKEPTGSFLALMATIQSFPIIPKGSLKTGERPSLFPPGTGPFSFVEWKTGQKLALKKFKDYWQKGIPRVDEITIRAISDDAVRFTALRTGELDLIEKLPHQHVERIQKGAVREANLVFASATGFRALIFNTQKPPLDKVKVRQALAWAIDKEEIMSGAHWGIATVTNQKMVPGSPWYFDIPDRKRDLEKARRMLREAGVSEKLKLKIVATTANKEEVPILQKQLEPIGIELEPEIVDFTTYIDRQHKGEFDLCTIGGLVASDPHANYYGYLHSEPDPQKRVRNLPGYSSSTVDKLLEDGRTTTNRKERLRIYREFAEVVQEEVPVIALGFSPFAFAMKPYVKGLEMNPQGRFFSGDTGLPMVWLEK